MHDERKTGQTSHGAEADNSGVEPADTATAPSPGPKVDMDEVMELLEMLGSPRSRALMMTDYIAWQLAWGLCAEREKHLLFALRDIKRDRPAGKICFDELRRVYFLVEMLAQSWFASDAEMREISKALRALDTKGDRHSSVYRSKERALRKRWWARYRKIMVKVAGLYGEHEIVALLSGGLRDLNRRLEIGSLLMIRSVCDRSS